MINFINTAINSSKIRVTIAFTLIHITNTVLWAIIKTELFTAIITSSFLILVTLTDTFGELAYFKAICLGLGVATVVWAVTNRAIFWNKTIFAEALSIHAFTMSWAKRAWNLIQILKVISTNRARALFNLAFILIEVICANIPIIKTSTVVDTFLTFGLVEYLDIFKVLYLILGNNLVY